MGEKSVYIERNASFPLHFFLTKAIIPGKISEQMFSLENIPENESTHGILICYFLQHILVQR